MRLLFGPAEVPGLEVALTVLRVVEPDGPPRSAFADLQVGLDQQHPADPGLVDEAGDLGADRQGDHQARTWYAFHELGLHRIMSAVIQGNEGSLKALTRSGYNLVYIERNTVFTDGQTRHQYNLECLNPRDPFWNQWWHGEKPTAEAIEARRLTRKALAWAEANVELA